MEVIEIPSIFDKLPLKCRVEHPAVSSAGDSHHRAAIIAHPYAPLGGSYDDRIVRHLAENFLAAGYVVGTFNFRGTQDSRGKTSYTGRAELADYVSFYGFMLRYLYTLDDALAERVPIDVQSTLPSQAISTPRDVEVVLAGYSYGSLITSHLPSQQRVASLFDHPQKGSSLEHICLKASELCSRRLSVSLDGRSFLSKAKPTRVAYLLVSPILPPISSFLTLTFFKNASRMDFAIEETAEIVQSEFIEQHVQRDPVMVLTGLDDGFTFHSALTKFEERMRKASGATGLFECIKFHDADHFWSGSDPLKLMEATLRQWLSTRKTTSSI